jgi:hypothetical protein
VQQMRRRIRRESVGANRIVGSARVRSVWSKVHGGC